MNEPAPAKLTARALLLGDRIDLAGLERTDTISLTPLAFHVGPSGRVALYRYGVAVLVGLSPLEEDDIIAKMKERIVGARLLKEDETAQLVLDGDDRIAPGGVIGLKDLSDARFLVFADALAKSVALGRDEREVSRVFDEIEPLAHSLARHGRPGRGRRDLLRLIGKALGAQHRVSGRVAVEEKPDVLWDRPDLERLYARLEDEYELKERAQTLQRKLDVIVETARALADLIDADRSSLMEAAIVVLIVLELAASLFQIIFQSSH
ncbi:RMD1 family protein [Rhodoblastus acidophilus]|uniref:RMD1 family protein n=1 Tax=Rhodoblastus acidophilus TaxID=1074 RepID=A0A6N8DVJ8_RHOAC|nr:RMD1 family protein [Rhodoblastus acidophilus]MCW2276221.1 putative Rmd1/YagE family protein [Rhodoblastus acidophilus]MTV32884.1 RMD1 family protein [Rhodoblastus acidophilus]